MSAPAYTRVWARAGRRLPAAGIFLISAGSGGGRLAGTCMHGAAARAVEASIRDPSAWLSEGLQLQLGHLAQPPGRVGARSARTRYRTASRSR